VELFQVPQFADFPGQFREPEPTQIELSGLLLFLLADPPSSFINAVHVCLPFGRTETVSHALA
jgi:hypothetical protein